MKSWPRQMGEPRSPQGKNLSVLTLECELAAQRFINALLRAQVLDLKLQLRANPYWHLQPRAPAGQPDGGQWLPSGPVVAPRSGPELLPLLPSIISLGVRAVAALRRAAGVARPYLRRLPKYWEGLWPSEEQFDEETRRIGPPSMRRPEHPLVRFKSETELRRYLGPAGEGREWHHIVEKRLAGRRFPAEMIHSTDNIVSLPSELHRRVSAEMSKLKKGSVNGLTVRKWLETQTFEKQHDFGLDLIHSLEGLR